MGSPRPDPTETPGNDQMAEMARQAEKAEQEKRAKEQKSWADMAFADLYSEKTAKWKRGGWEVVGSSDNKKDDTPSLSTGPESPTVFEKGKLYKHKDLKDINIDYSKDGVVKIKPPGPLTPQRMGVMLDFLGNQGFKSVVFSLPPIGADASSLEKKIYKEQCQMAINAAAEKGLKITFDESTTQALKEICTKGEYENFDKAIKDSAVNQKKNDMMVGKGFKEPFKEQADALDNAGNVNKQTDTSTPEERSQRLLDKIEKDEADAAKPNRGVSEQATQVAAEIAALKTRAAEVSRVGSSLLNGLEAQQHVLDHPEELGQADQLKSFKAGTAQVNKNKFQDVNNVIDDVENRNQQVHGSRGDLLSAMNSELKEINRAVAVLEKKLETLEHLADPKLLEDQKKELTKRENELGAEPAAGDPKKQEWDDKKAELDADKAQFAELEASVKKAEVDDPVLGPKLDELKTHEDYIDQKNLERDNISNLLKDPTLDATTKATLEDQKAKLTEEITERQGQKAESKSEVDRSRADLKAKIPEAKKELDGLKGVAKEQGQKYESAKSLHDDMTPKQPGNKFDRAKEKAEENKKNQNQTALRK